MGRVAAAVKTVISLGGTGVPFTTSRANDVVYGVNLNDRRSVAGVSVTADKAMGYIPFFAAVRDISEDVAGLPLNVYVADTRDKDTAHPVHKLLHSKSNPYMSAFTFRETLQAHVLTWGNGYAEIEYNTDGSIRALWPLRPDRMDVLVESSTGVPFYRYRLGNGDTVDLPRRNVFHVHGLGYDGLIGYSIIEKTRHTLGMALASEKWGEDWFTKGGVPPAALVHPKTLSDTARDNLRKSIDDGTLTDRQRMALLEEGLDIKVFGIPAKDSAFLETLDDTRSLMATLFRMPPDMLGDVDRSTSWGSGIEQQGIGYVKYALRSWLNRWEQQGNLQLLPGEDRYLKHVVDGLLSGDTAARWRAYEAGLRTGVYCIDDILEMEDRNPLPDGQGQRHFVPLNMAPLDQVGEMSMSERFAALGALNRAGFQPDSSLEALDLPPIDHTGLEPVTVSEQGDYARNGNGRR